MKLGFTKFKDRIWFAVDRTSRWVAEGPAPVQAVGYGTLRGILWSAYHLPKSPLPKAANAFATVLADGRRGRDLYSGFVDRFVLALRRMEALRLGATEDTDALFRCADQDRLDAVLSTGRGAFIVMPHCHASILMVRGLASRYPVLMLVRPPAKQSRAEAMDVYYGNLGCDRLDVRNVADLSVARKIVSAIRKGTLVIGVVDRIKAAPPEEEPYNLQEDAMRAEAFGQPVGAIGWPARFSRTCQAPVLPAMIEMTEEAVTLHLGEPIEGGDERAVTQAWVSALEDFFHAYPLDWGFLYDKFWTRTVSAAAEAGWRRTP